MCIALISPHQLTGLKTPAYLLTYLPCMVDWAQSTSWLTCTSLSPDIILCGWMGSKHQQTSTSLSHDITLRSWLGSKHQVTSTSLSHDITPCGWLGSKHQLTSTSLSHDMTLRGWLGSKHQLTNLYFSWPLSFFAVVSVECYVRLHPQYHNYVLFLLKVSVLSLCFSLPLSSVLLWVWTVTIVGLLPEYCMYCSPFLLSCTD